jgi:hypothetical protein
MGVLFLIDFTHQFFFVSQEFLCDMEKALQDGEENSPTKATVDSVLPGVYTQFTNLHHEIKRMQDGLQELKGMTRGGIDGTFVLFF